LFYLVFPHKEGIAIWFIDCNVYIIGLRESSV